MNLIANGAMPNPDCKEPWFLSNSHSDADIDRTLEYYEDVVRRALAGHY
jgi:glutamate-1-semialdehyde aminotransferase